MKCSLLFFTALWLVLTNYSRALRVDDMDTLYGDVDLFSPKAGFLSSGILKSHTGFWYTPNRNKTVYVRADYGYSILVSIKFIDFRPNRQDSLKLFAINGHVPVTPATYTNTRFFRDRRYFSREQETFYVPSGQLGITFSTGSGFSTSGYDGFQLTYTSQAPNSLKCESRDFHCKNGRCIAKTLTCDDHNHCGDGSSQQDCSGSIGRKAGIACGVIFLLIAIGCGVYIVLRRARNSSIETHTVVTSHPPPSTNLPSYPPAYPQPGTYYPPPPPPYSQGISNPTYH